MTHNTVTLISICSDKLILYTVFEGYWLSLHNSVFTFAYRYVSLTRRNNTANKRHVKRYI